MLMSADMFGRAMDRLLDMPFVFDTVCVRFLFALEEMLLFSLPFLSSGCTSAHLRANDRPQSVDVSQSGAWYLHGGENATFNDFCRA